MHNRYNIEGDGLWIFLVPFKSISVHNVPAYRGFSEKPLWENDSNDQKLRPSHRQ